MLMIGFIFLAALRQIVFGMLVLALSLAPLQAYAAPNSDVGMAMTKMDCPQKKSCCDKSKSDCAMNLSCAARCTGGLVCAVPFKQVVLNVYSSAFGAAQLDSIESHASPPLRRPPRI